ncbi:hypothetical protein [Streptomyces candidus]|uniref:Secreted protein n=1 Tax=Streptomyces candidus TaxID=67283 RepID=A0A7X0LP41_9ACTN|nr:hypothetical protein [Streptomyces candidus]MBB6434521.1 hypothetical protein [Streptomyces candidus]GHH36442.1 hypothetical protein GCM10018773_11370 [Streptomyces candidus]
MTHRIRMAAATVAAGLVPTATGLGTAAQADAPHTPAASKGQAAAPCWHSSGKWWCNNKRGAAVWAADSVTIVGYMHSNPSWFTCRLDADPTGGGGPHPNRWLLTKADNGRVGWMKDSDVYSETDPVRPC